MHEACPLNTVQYHHSHTPFHHTNPNATNVLSIEYKYITHSPTHTVLVCSVQYQRGVPHAMTQSLCTHCCVQTIFSSTHVFHTYETRQAVKSPQCYPPKERARAPLLLPENSRRAATSIPEELTRALTRPQGRQKNVPFGSHYTVLILEPRCAPQVPHSTVFCMPIATPCTVTSA